MIQLNLLPDVKLEYIKAQKVRSLVLSISVLISIGAIVLLVLLLAVNGLQKKHLSDLSTDIAARTAELKRKPQIDKILTVQNQLNSLTALHAAKPAAYNLFSYLNEATPSQVSISNFHIDFTTQVITITGAADSLGSVNKYVDTLKYTTFKPTSKSPSQPAFSSVVLSSFGVASKANQSGQAANYSINLSYDPQIFDITKNIKLKVPSTTTTRSEDNPGSLFQAPANTTTTPTTGGTN